MDSVESTTSTTFHTTAYRANSGAIILNRIATTTTTQKKDDDKQVNADGSITRQKTSKQRIRRIVIKKKQIDQSDLNRLDSSPNKLTSL